MSTLNAMLPTSKAKKISKMVIDNYFFQPTGNRWNKRYVTALEYCGRLFQFPVFYYLYVEVFLKDVIDFFRFLQ